MQTDQRRRNISFAPPKIKRFKKHLSGRRKAPVFPASMMLRNVTVAPIDLDRRRALRRFDRDFVASDIPSDDTRISGGDLAGAVAERDETMAARAYDRFGSLG